MQLLSQNQRSKNAMQQYANQARINQSGATASGKIEPLTFHHLQQCTTNRLITCMFGHPVNTGCMKAVSTSTWARQHTDAGRTGAYKRTRVCESPPNSLHKCAQSRDTIKTKHASQTLRDGTYRSLTPCARQRSCAGNKPWQGTLKPTSLKSCFTSSSGVCWAASCLKHTQRIGVDMYPMSQT